MKMIKFALCLVVLTLMTGCPPGPVKTATLGSPGYQLKEYRIQPGDLLEVKLFYNPELNELLTVRPDGRITLQLINDVAAAGLTPAQLGAVLTKAYAGELANPRVVVIVRTPVAERVYVDGEVNRAGAFTLPGPTTVLQSIAEAGGLKDTADPGEVRVLRRAGDGVKIITLNLEAALNGEDASQDIYAQANDLILVPRSGIANVNAWVDKYIRKNIPLPIGIGISPL